MTAKVVNAEIRSMDSTTSLNRIPDRKMTREELHTVGDNLLMYINTPDPSPEHLSKMVAQDVATPLFYPGMRTGYAGVKELLHKLHAALSDYSMQLVTPIIDERAQTVVFFVKSVGVQTGYSPRLPENGGINSWVGNGGGCRGRVRRSTIMGF
jgi:hypothetical protein